MLIITGKNKLVVGVNKRTGQIAELLISTPLNIFPGIFIPFP